MPAFVLLSGKELIIESISDCLALGLLLKTSPNIPKAAVASGKRAMIKL